MIRALMIGIAYFAMTETFRNVTGGPLNPAIALAQIVWQMTTYKYEPGFTWSKWTGDYATMYLMGPFLGGLMAGNFYNYLKRVEFRLAKQAREAKEAEQRAKLENRETDAATRAKYY